MKGVSLSGATRRFDGLRRVEQRASLALPDMAEGDCLIDGFGQNAAVPHVLGRFQQGVRQPRGWFPRFTWRPAHLHLEIPA
jgi:hypothetical protein